MHFTFFIINLIGWTLIGLLIGIIALRGHRRKESLTVFLSTFSAILGGAFSFATHGMWIDMGIDFFNFSAAMLLSTSVVYIFIPERREAINNIFAKAANIINSNFSKAKDISQNPNLGRNFTRNITSSLVSR